jgi:hypothetical protein
MERKERGFGWEREEQGWKTAEVEKRDPVMIIASIAATFERECPD